MSFFSYFLGFFKVNSGVFLHNRVTTLVLTLLACLWLNTDHLRNFRSDNLSQDKSSKEIIFQQDKEKFQLKMIGI